MLKLKNELLYSFSLVCLMLFMTPSTYILVLLFSSALIFYLYNVTNHNERTASQTYIGICLTIFLVLYAFYKVMFFSWALSDDYMVVAKMPNHAQLSFSGFIESFLTDKELGNFLHNDTGRFRPVFVFVCLVNQYFWGDHISLWYTEMLIVFVVSFVFLYLIFQKYVDFYVSSILISALLSLPVWSLLFRDIGLSEVYYFFGMTSMLLGIVYFDDCVKVRNTWKHIFIMLSAFIAIGSKENVLLIGAVPILYCIYRSIWKGERSKNLLFALLNALLSFFVFINLVLCVSRRGVDFYGYSFSLKDKIYSLYQAFVAFSSVFDVYIFIGIHIILFCLLYYFYKSRIRTKSIVTYVSIVLFLILFFMTQYVVYYGRFLNQHYAFPAIVIPLALYIVLFVASYVFSGLNCSQLIFKLIGNVGIAFFLFFSVSNGYCNVHLIDDLYKKREHTKHVLETIKQLGKNGNDIAIRITDVGSVEMVYSFPIFLRRVSDIKNNIYIFLDKNGNDVDPFFEYFSKQIMQTSESGYLDIIAPIDQFSDNDDTIHLCIGNVCKDGDTKIFPYDLPMTPCFHCVNPWYSEHFSEGVRAAQTLAPK